MSFSTSLKRLSSFRTVARTPCYRTTFFRANSTVVAHHVANLSSIISQMPHSDNTVSAIHTHYPILVAKLLKTPTTSSSKLHPLLTYEQLAAMLEALATSGRPADLQRIEEILNDMPRIFGFRLTIDTHTVIIRGLIKHGNDQTIFRWLLSMPSRPVPFTPTLEQFHMFLEACLQLSPFKFVRHVVRSMRQTGCKPTNETFKYLIRSRWDAATQEDKIPHVMTFTSILDEMKMANMWYDPSIEKMLYDYYAERGHERWAEEVKSQYQARFTDIQTNESRQETAWCNNLSWTAQSRGIEAAIRQFKQLQPQGCTPSARILRAILRHSRSQDDLRTVETEIGQPLAVDHWSLVITNNIRAGDVANALSIYRESKTAGIVPDAALVHPLLKALCQSSPGPPPEDSLDNALAIYRDLIAIAPSSPTTHKKSYNDHSVGPDASIYHILLRALALATNPEKYLPIAKDLLDDMDGYNVSTNDSFTASSIIVLFMRHASTQSEALDAYHNLRSSLDEKGYAIVLNAFAKTSFGDEFHVPSLSTYFEIIKDMRRAGLEITVEVYTILLGQLAAVATKLRYADAQAHDDLRSKLITVTRRTHDFLTLDAAVSPDEQVWNQLMDTYQRLGCFGDAYRVWETMYLSGRFNHVSVSIILDACGYAGAWHSARRVCTQLFRDRFSFNLHNWNTWVECLCRLHRLGDAVKVVCLEMGENQNTVAPDVETVRILMKFARRDNQEAAVLERLERHVPELWKSLPEDLRSGPQNNQSPN